MSTRCQIGFYSSPETPLERPDVVVYRHHDGYPDGKSGVVEPLLAWARDFKKERGLDNTCYCSARCLVALMKASGHLYGKTGYGIDGDRQLHFDIEYYYRVDPQGITVYDTRTLPKEPSFNNMKKLAFYGLDGRGDWKAPQEET